MGSQKHIFGNLLNVIYWVTLPIGMGKDFTDLGHWGLKIIPYAQWEHADFWPLKLKIKHLLDSPDCRLAKVKVNITGAATFKILYGVTQRDNKKKKLDLSPNNILNPTGKDVINVSGNINKAGKLISILRCDGLFTWMDYQRPMKCTVSKTSDYYFSLKLYILVKIIYPFSLDFCPSKQQVNKWLHGDCLEERRERERSTKPVVKRNCFQWGMWALQQKQQSHQCPPRSRQKIMMGTMYHPWTQHRNPGFAFKSLSLGVSLYASFPENPESYRPRWGAKVEERPLSFSVRGQANKPVLCWTGQAEAMAQTKGLPMMAIPSKHRFKKRVWTHQSLSLF